MSSPVVSIAMDPLGLVLVVTLLLVAIAAPLFAFQARTRNARWRSAGLQHLLRELPQGVLLLDEGGRTQWRNREADRVAELHRTDSEFEHELAGLAERVRASRRAELCEIASGDVRFQVKAFPLIGAHNSVRGVAYLVEDIGDRRHQEEFLQHFISSVSHELLTPLAAITGHAAKLRETAADDVENRNMSLTIIEQEVKRLTTLTSNLLVLSRLESDTPLRLEPVRVSVPAEDAVAGLLLVAKTKGLSLSVETESRLPLIRADRDRLKQVFINLVDNAIKYCPEGTQVRVQLCTRDNHIVATVSDNGPGIPSEDLPHIFTKMYRVQKEGTRDIRGSGLGLAIVKRIVELHGGQITVDSALGQGTTFTVILPVSPSVA